MPPLFRSIPPFDLLIQLLNTVGLNSIQDSQWFSKNQIQLHEFQEILPILEPYYIPCKADIYIHANPFTQSHAITIIRQVLKVHSYTLKASEKTRIGEKTTWYQIIPQKKEKEILINDVTISFD